MTPRDCPSLSQADEFGLRGGLWLKNTEYLSQAIRDLYRILVGLDTEYRQHPCSFLLDGILLGSIDEVFVAALLR